MPVPCYGNVLGFSKITNIFRSSSEAHGKSLKIVRLYFERMSPNLGVKFFNRMVSTIFRRFPKNVRVRPSPSENQDHCRDLNDLTTSSAKYF